MLPYVLHLAFHAIVQDAAGFTPLMRLLQSGQASDVRTFLELGNCNLDAQVVCRLGTLSDNNLVAVYCDCGVVKLGSGNLLHLCFGEPCGVRAWLGSSHDL